MGSDADPDDLHEFDQIQRVTERVGRGAAVGIPTWLVLLLLLPLSGMGALPCLVGATLIAAGIVIWAERRRARRRDAEADEARGGTPEPRQMSPLAAVGLTLGAVVLLAYIVLVIRAA